MKTELLSTEYHYLVDLKGKKLPAKVTFNHGKGIGVIVVTIGIWEKKIRSFSNTASAISANVFLKKALKEFTTK